MKRRRLLGVLALAPALVLAETRAPRLAVPYYRAADFVGGVHKQWFAPRARDFETEAAQLESRFQAACNGQPTSEALSELRRHWQRTALAWDRLAGVAIGPMLSRRSARQIDFWPIRPDAIVRAIQAAPSNLAALERVGTPAKGLGALEWILWSRKEALGQGACGYAALLAGELHLEAQALGAAFQDLARRDWEAEPQQAEAGMAEIVNQWVGGLESLRWQRMDRPRRSAGGGAAYYPRQAGGMARASWAARWEALAAIGAADPARAAPAPGEGLVSLETYLRGRGLNPLANKLGDSIATAQRTLRSVDPAAGSRVTAATSAIARAKQLAEAEVAPALDVQLGFSDSDGD